MTRDEFEKGMAEGSFKFPEFNHPEVFSGSDGYEKLKESVLWDYAGDKTYQEGGHPFHDYKEKFDWIINQAMHYSETTGLSATDILDAWEKPRDWWYMNYYGRSRQPDLKDGKVRIFENLDDFHNSLNEKGFYCPNCGGVSNDPQKCDTHRIIKRGRKAYECDWCSYGLFGTMGKGARFFLKSTMLPYEIFMPVAWEQQQNV